MRGVSSAVRFLTPLLSLHSEIGAVRLVDEGTTIIFEFYLDKALPTAPLREWTQEVKDAYNCFFFVSGIKSSYLVVGRAHHASRSTESMSDGMPQAVNSYACSPDLTSSVDNSCALSVEREIASLSYEEISMLMNLMSGYFNESLIRSCIVNNGDISASVQQLRHNLDLFREEVRTNVDDKGEQIEHIPDIIGYCEDMRIVVSYANNAKHVRKKAVASAK
ncbi:MAG: hypothetical protein K6G50_06815 [bacterium]|nr:hypothetical protein [bacterium]